MPQSLPYVSEGANFVTPAELNPLLETWNGAGSTPGFLTGIDDDAYPAFSIRNRGAGAGLLVQDTLGADLLGVDDLGTTLTNLFGSGTASIDGDTALGALLSVVGAGTFQSTLDVAGAGSFADILDVSGDGTFGASVDVADDLTVGGNLAITGTTALTGTLTLTGALVANGAVTLGNAAGDAITVTGTMAVAQIATFALGIVVTTGGLTFTASTPGQRILGDLSGATLANRLMIQTSTPNDHSFLGLLPNGTAIIASYQAYGASNPAASAYVQMAAVAGVDVRIASEHNGAAYLPLTFWNNGAEQMRIAANGDIKIGSSTSLKIGFFGNLGAAQVTGGAATAGATYTSDEQDMLQILWDMARDYGLLS